jgi:hypothetical protein
MLLKTNLVGKDRIPALVDVRRDLLTLVLISRHRGAA